MSWSGRRQGLYIASTTVVTVAVVGLIAYAILSRTPNCADSIQNGTETGVDCGGACTRICSEDTRKPVVLWARSFMVAPGVYTAAAYYNNNNRGAFVRQAHYLFQLRDADNHVIAERQGVTALPPGRVSAIVETNISTGNSIPAHTLFSFTDSDLVWERGEVPQIEIKPDPLDVDARRQTARISNLSPRDIDALPLTVILFDANDTAVAASQTLINRLQKNGNETAVFTWPSPFESTPVRAELLPILIPR